MRLLKYFFISHKMIKMYGSKSAFPFNSLFLFEKDWDMKN
jgi:hypothetical protein